MHNFNWKPLVNFSCLIFFGVLLTILAGCESESRATGSGVVKLIFDTDMGPDYDDVGAIAMVHALADSGECELLATVASDGHPMVAPTIKLFNSYYHRADVPVGRAVPGAPAFIAPNGWNDTLVNRFAPEVAGAEYPDAVTVYRKVLSAEQDHSVTIVTVGFLSNLHALLLSGPDQYSELDGVTLVRKKVKKLVAMAGLFPDGLEFNIHEHPAAAAKALEAWPTPILFTGFEIGSRIFTGAEVAKSADEQACPVAAAYAFNFRTYAPHGESKRASWDQTAVLIAVRNPERYFYVNGPGTFKVAEDGVNRWDPDQDSQHYFVVHKYPIALIEAELEKLMLHKPM